MVEIEVRNEVSRIVGQLDTDSRRLSTIQDALREALSYDVIGAEYNIKYRLHEWDGKVSLYQKREQKFPTGLVEKVRKVLAEYGVDYKFNIQRAKPETDTKITFNPERFNRSLRDYQVELVAAAISKTRGVIELATGGGKTLAACEIIAQLDTTPVVFIVPTQSLMYQTQREFEQYLEIDGQPTEVGLGGNGVCTVRTDGINVITYQTALQAFDLKYQVKGDKVIYDPDTGLKTRESTENLRKAHLAAAKLLEDAERNATASCANLLKSNGGKTRAYISAFSVATKTARLAHAKAKQSYEDRLSQLENKQRVRGVISQCQVFIVDEAHTAAVITQALGERAVKAYWRWALSATPWREDNQTIRIEGTFGRKCFRKTSSELIREEYLLKPFIKMVKIAHNEVCATYEEAYQANIINCVERNYRIKRFAEEFRAAGMPVLILVERLEHGEILEELISGSIFVPGGDSKHPDEEVTNADINYRLDMLRKTGKNEHVLIATQWANVGVDEPGIQVLILAGSCASSVTTMQQVGRVLRCLGPNARVSTENGKAYAVVIDFMDSEKDMHKHSLRRKRTYELENEYDVEIVR